MTAENNRANALTVGTLAALNWAIAQAAKDCDGVHWRSLMSLRKALLAAPPIEQPATAQIDTRHVERFAESCGEGGGVYPNDEGDFVRYADYVAAVHRAEAATEAVAVTPSKCKPGGCSAIGCEGGFYCFNEDGSQKPDPTPEHQEALRAALVPYCSPSMASEAVAWVRKHPDTGALSGDWLWNDNIEQCRKDSGVWFPLGFIGTTKPAQKDDQIKGTK